MLNISSYQTILPIFGGRRFVSEKENLSYNALLYKFKDSIPRSPTYEEKLKGQEILKKLKKIDTESEKMVLKRSRLIVLLTVIKRFFGNWGIDRKGVLNEIENALNITKDDIKKHNHKHFSLLDNRVVFAEFISFCSADTILALAQTCTSIQDSFKQEGSTLEKCKKKLSKYRQELKDIANPMLIRALGGYEIVANFPKINLSPSKPFSHVIFDELKAPLIRGSDSKGNPFIAIRYNVEYTEDTKTIITDELGVSRVIPKKNYLSSDYWEFLYFHKTIEESNVSFARMGSEIIPPPGHFIDKSECYQRLASLLKGKTVNSRMWVHNITDKVNLWKPKVKKSDH